jgi:hypothetical protein
MQTQTQLIIGADNTLLIKQYKQFGFDSQDAMIARAFALLLQETEQQRLQESANLYAELYEQDTDAHQWVNAAITDWK